MEHIHGFVAAVHTPFDADGQVRLDVIPRQIEHLVANGMQGAFVCGTTGESLSLTISERRQVVETWVQGAPDSLRVIVHVGHNSMAEAQSLARHAQQTGAYAVAAMPPVFFRPRGATSVVDFCQRVAAAAPGLPFYYYHIPSMTHVDVCIADFLIEAIERVPTLAGVKFTHNDLFDFGRALDVAEGRVQLLFGYDEMLLSALVLGATGGVGGTYALAPEIYQGILNAYLAGDLEAARLWQRRSRQLVDVLLKAGGVPAMKATMKINGIDCGPVRPPLSDLDAAEFQQLQQRLEELQT